MPLPGEPRAAERLYTAELTRIWGLAQTVITWGVTPLLNVWPTGDLQRIDEYNPLERQPRRRPIVAMTDAELRALWPSIAPADLRRHAPWATSHNEVIRVAFPGQGLPADSPSLEEFVRRAVRLSQQSPWSGPSGGDVGEVRGPGPGAFRLQPRFQVPVIIGPNGLPIPPPPLPTVVNVTTIGRQIDWLKLSTTQLVTTSNLEQVIGRQGQRVDKHVARTLRTLIPIDIRQAVPGIQQQIDTWRDLNVDLIESGIYGERIPRPHLRSLLGDVTETIEQAHRQGVRVEVLAQDLVDRYGVSNSRAALIARDQTLKLNGQINRSRQQAAGVEEYTWRATKDLRTRKGHRELDGTVHNWNAPPDTGRGNHHPGDEYQCRCQAIPVIKGFVSSAGRLEPLKRPGQFHKKSGRLLPT